jgi:hypothetical protein
MESSALAVWLGDGAAICEHGEQCIGIIPRKEPYILSPVRRFEHREVELWTNSIPRFDIDVHTNKNCRFRTRALQEPNVKVVPQIEVGLDPHVDLA